MNNFFTLSKALLINSFRPITYSKRSHLKFFIILAFLPMMFGIFSFTSNIFPTLKGIGQEGIILGYGFSFVSMAIFYIGIFAMLTVLYYSTDLETLLYMPFSASTILCSKFLITLVYEYITTAIIILPIIISYAIQSNSGVLFYIYSAIIFFTIPIFPLVIAGIIDIFIMRFTRVFKNKDRFRTIGGILSLFIAIGINFYIQKISIGQSSPEDVLELINQGDNSLLNITSKLFPGIQLAVKAMINSENIYGLSFLMLFLLLNIVFIMIFIYVGEKLYLNGAIGINESSASKVVISKNALDKYLTKHSPIVAFALKEIKIIFRTPAYFMNCVVVNFIWPIFVVLPFILDNSLFAKINELLVLINSGDFDGVIVAVAFSIGAFMSSANGITSSSISRDGKNFYVNKYIPISYISQISAKILSGVILSSFSTILIILIVSIALRVRITLLIISITFGLLGILISSMFGISMDIISPKLVWDNEQKAVKQNFNVLIHTFLGLGLAVGAVYLVIRFRLDLLLTLLVLGTTFLTIFALLYFFISTKGIKIYKEI